MISGNLLKAALLGLFMALIFGSCKKDNIVSGSFPDEGGTSSQAGYRDPSSGDWHFTNEEVKQYFEEKQAEVAGGTYTEGSDTVRHAMANAELLWGFADTVLYAGSVDVLIVPVKAPAPSQLALGKEAYFIFFDEWGSLSSRLMLIWADDSYISDNAGAYPNSFTGYIFQFTWDGVIDYSVRAELGSITHQIRDSELLDERDYDCYPGETVPFSFGGGSSSGTPIAAAISSIQLFMTYFTCFEFGNAWEGAFNSIDWFGLGNTHSINPPGNANNSGINPYYIGDFFGLSQFSGEEYLMAQAVNKFKERYGLVFSGAQTWDMIQQNCSGQFGGAGPNPLVFFHQLNGFLSAPAESMNPCLQAIIEDNALNILSQGFGLTLDEQQLHDIFSMDCIYGGDFEACAETEIENWLINYFEGLGTTLTTDQNDWITTQSPLFLADLLEILIQEQSEEEKGNLIVLLFNESNINLFATNASNTSTITPLIADDAPNTNSEWADLTPLKIWELAGPIKQDLKSRYPSQSSKIDDWFPCRVLGVAFERAVLNSLAIQNNTASLPGYSSIPDGLVTRKITDFPNGQFWIPNVIEVKGRFSTGANPIFDYSGQQLQLQDYLNYLQGVAYNSTLAHGLYLILPSGVTLGQNIVNQANAQNIPIFFSTVEQNKDIPNEIRVKPLDFVNVSNIDRSDLLFNFLPDFVVEIAVRRQFQNSNYSNPKLRYINATLDIQQAANDFEVSYLIPNVTPLECSD